MDSITTRLDAKLLYRRLDSLFGELDPARAPRQLMEWFLPHAFETLRSDLRLEGGLLYAEVRDGFELARSVGRITGTAAEMVHASQVPWRLVLQHGVYIFADPDHDDSPAHHGMLPRRPCAAVVLGRRPQRHVMVFLLADGWIREEIDFTLNTVRAALGWRLMERRVRGTVKQAAEIQQSLLVDEPPAFEGFELAARSVAAEEVGGDFYDFVRLGDDLLGLSIGDASGHGLPAALLVRDVVTGLRMGLEKHLKVAHVFSKLNRVIHRSNLSSRFISVFYGELDHTGSLIYVNAGHPPPLLFTEDHVVELTIGGTVIGPLPEAAFRRGVAYLKRGDFVVMCTDGILERRDRQGQFFGEERLRATARAERTGSAEQIIDRIFDTAFAFGREAPWEDDATALVVKRIR